MATPLEPPVRKHQFRLAYAVLVVIFFVSSYAFVILLKRSHHDPAKQVAWSAWKPADSGLLGAREIGHKVAPQYKDPLGNQLVAVQEHPPEVEGVPLESIGVRRMLPTGAIDPYIGLFPAGHTLIYSFCGLLSNCAVSSDVNAVPSQLLRREALELSLYSFKYLKNIDQVVSLLQPTAKSGNVAVFMRKDQLTRELESPLADTLRLAGPNSTASGAQESSVLDTLTLQNTFPAHFESLPDGDAILVLDVAASTG